MNEPSVKRLGNGLRVVLVPCEAESVAVGLFIASGSRHEGPKEAGISHFIEHMLFKGTPTRKPIDITRAIEGRGGNFNAYTGEEATCYYAHLPDEYLAEAVDILGDMYLHATIPEEEFRREREVIVEEIRMYADEPDSVAMENLQRALFPGHPLGCPVAGTPESLLKMKAETLRRYIRSHYTPGRTVAVIVGSFDPDEALGIVAKRFASPVVDAASRRVGKKEESFAVDAASRRVGEREESFAVDAASRRVGEKEESFLLNAAGTPRLRRNAAGTPRLRRNAAGTPRLRVEPLTTVTKDIQQAQLALGYRTFGVIDPRRYAATVMDAVLGRGMSSRLFQEVREKRGLSYDIQSRMQFFQDAGLWTVTAGLDAAKREKALATVDRELKRLTETRVGAAELKRTKDFLIGNFRLSHEKVTSRLFFYGSTMLAFGRLMDPHEQVEGVRAVTADDVRAVARALFRPANRSVSWVLPRT